MAEKRQKVLFAILGVLVVVFLARMLMGGGGGGGGESESSNTGSDRRTEETSTMTFGDSPAATTPGAPTDTPTDTPSALDYPPTRNPFAPAVSGVTGGDGDHS